MTRLSQRLLWLGALVLLAVTTVSVGLAVSSTGRLNHVSGVWITLATDLAGGEFYRPLLSERGYGGTRFFPLHFLLHAGLIKLGIPVLTAGYCVTFSATAAMVAAMFRVLRVLGVGRSYAAVFAVLTLASMSSHLAVTTIRSDLLPAVLNLCGLGFCAVRMREQGFRWALPGAAVCFVMAFSAKITTLFGFAAALVFLLLHGQRRAARDLGFLTLAGMGLVVTAVHLASQGRATASILACASGGATLGEAVGGPGRMLVRAATRDPVTLCAAILAVGGMLVTWRTRRVELGSVALIIAVLVTAVIFGSPGTDYNHLLDMYVISLLSLAVQSSQKERHALAVSGLLVTIGLAGSIHSLVRLPSALERTDAARRAIIARLYEEKRAELPILSQDPMLPILLGQRPLLLDPFMLRLTRAQVPAITADFWRRIETRQFRTVILMVDPRSEAGSRRLRERHFGTGFTELLLQHYRYHAQHGRYFLYRPRDDESAENAADETERRGSRAGGSV